MISAAVEARPRTYWQYTEIVPGLYQGGAPEPGALPFDLIVFAAVEYQPTASAFPGSVVLHVPYEDDAEVPVQAIHTAARHITRALRRGKRVLITCAMGLNRSGLITALVLMNLLGWSGARAVSHVQRARFGALSNPWFTAYLTSLPARRV